MSKNGTFNGKWTAKDTEYESGQRKDSICIENARGEYCIKGGKRVVSTTTATKRNTNTNKLRKEKSRRVDDDSK